MGYNVSHRKENPVKLIFLGPAGAGKGTLAEKATGILNVPHISTGAIFRSAIDAGTPLGLKVKAIIDEGKLVDDETTIELVKERLAQKDTQKGYILDGFPRTIFQAEALTSFELVDKVIDLDIPDSLVYERLSSRLVCRACGHNFHKVFDKPTKDGVCNHCNGEVYTRDDDKVEAIQKRIEVYRSKTAPLIDYYREKNLLLIIDASPSIDKVVENFKKALGL
jgi:adenylate kinase